VAPLYSVSLYLPTIIGAFGHDRITSNLLSVPVYFLGAIVILSLSWHSDTTGERGWHVIIPSALSAIGFLICGGASMFDLNVLRYI